MPGPDQQHEVGALGERERTPPQAERSIGPNGAKPQANDPAGNLPYNSTVQVQSQQTAKKKSPLLWRMDDVLELCLAPILVAFTCFFVGTNSEHDLKLHVLENLERFVLSIVAAFATFNYQKTLGRLKSWTLERHAYLLNLLTGANAFLFGFVIYFSKPTLRLTGIVAIYAVFVGANVLQVFMSLNQCSDRKRRATLVLEAYTFLRQENAPTLVAYALVVVAITVAPHFLEVDETLIKVFTGGIAAFHLGLSVIQYSIAIRKNDPVEVVLDRSEWTEGAYERVDKISASLKRWGFLLAAPVLVAAVAMMADIWPLIVPGRPVVLKVPNLVPKPPIGDYQFEDHQRHHL
jgi:hypothetical protein